MPGTSAAVFVLREGRVALAEPVTALQSTYGAAVSTLLRGDGLTDAIMVADAQRDPRLSGIAADLSTAGIRAIVVVPLRFRDEPIGAIALASPEPGRFADDTAAILRRQAPPIALALGGALLAASATRSEDELEAALGSERRPAASSTAQETVARIAAEGWPRDRAVAAAARAALDLLDVDATCLLVPDGARRPGRGGLRGRGAVAARARSPRARPRSDRRERRPRGEPRRRTLAAAARGRARPTARRCSARCSALARRRASSRSLIDGQLVAARSRRSRSTRSGRWTPIALERAERFAPALALLAAAPVRLGATTHRSDWNHAEVRACETSYINAHAWNPRASRHA